MGWSHTFESYLQGMGTRIRIEVPLAYHGIKGVALHSTQYDTKSQKIIIEATLKTIAEENPLEESETPRRLQ
jgi:hypothetical protein